MKNNLELIPKTSPSKFLPGLAFFMSRNIIADSQMNTRNIMNTLINFTRTGLPMLWKLTVPMNRAIVHNAACNDGTTFVCIASGVIFLNCVISKCKDSEKTPIIKISMVFKSSNVGVLSDEMNRLLYELWKFMDSIKIFPIFSTYTRFRSMRVLTRPPTIPFMKSCSNRIISCTHDVNLS